jgi:voltage-gated sodium channel type II alpha
MGFILDPGSYLRDAWNWLDFIVVVSSLLTVIPQMTTVSGMRTFRLMRPLRSLTTMPSMKILISTLLASVAQLGGVLILAVFFFTIFAILGVSLWSGKIYYRCRITEFPIDGDWVADPDDTSLCSTERQCPLNRWCGSLAEAYRSDDPLYKIDSSIDIRRDSSIEDLNFGYSSFNHLPSAFLTIF